LAALVPSAATTILKISHASQVAARNRILCVLHCPERALETSECRTAPHVRRPEVVGQTIKGGIK
jgi:hypothetical protein